MYHCVIFSVPPLFSFFLFFFYSYGDHRDLHSFPTRRSSDLERPRREALLVEVQLPQHAADHVYLRSEEHTSELQSHSDLVCRLLLEKKKNDIRITRREIVHSLVRTISRESDRALEF